MAFSRQLPLNALRAFEAAARTGSFVLAAGELNVSSAAVSQQVKNLESHMGKKLFVRRGNRISLTDAGEILYPEIADAFERITARLDVMQAVNRPQQIVVSALPALSANWVLPKLAEFRDVTSASVLLQVENDPVDVSGKEVKLRVTYGSLLYEGHKQTEIFPGEAIAVCAPAFVRQFGDRDFDIGQISDQYFIHNLWGETYGSAPQWRDWMQLNLFENLPDPSLGFGISDMAIVILAALQGDGLALVPSKLVEDELKRGRLIKIPQNPLKMKKNYVAIFSNAKAEHPLVVKLLDILRSDNKAR